MRKLVLLGVVVLAFAAAPSASAVSSPLSCTFDRGTTSCTWKSFGLGPLFQYRCESGAFSTRSGLNWTEIVWTYAGNVVAKLDGVHPSFAPHSEVMLPKVFPGVRFLGEASRTEVVEWDPWQFSSAEDSAIICAGGDFLLP